MAHSTLTATIDLSDVLSSLRARRRDVDRAAESLGVAAEIVGTGSLAPGQMAVVAEGLRDLQADLHDLSDALMKLVQGDDATGW